MNLLVCALCLGGLTQEPVLSFRSPNGAFELWNFATVTWEAPKTGDQPPTMHAVVDGNLFRLRWRDRGIDLSGKTAIVDAARASNGAIYLTRANVAGGVTLSRDTEEARKYFAEQGQPASGPNRSKMTLTTEALSYAGDSAQGSINLPRPFAISGQDHLEGSVTRKGANVAQTADDGMDVRGESGTVTFSTEVANVNSLRTASILAPKVKLTRQTVTGGVTDPSSTIDAVADRMDLDFTGAQHMITLTGNVTVNGASETYAGYTKATKAVIFFGADGRITRIEMTGSPTETNVKPRQAVGGGRP